MFVYNALMLFMTVMSVYYSAQVVFLSGIFMFGSPALKQKAKDNFFKVSHVKEDEFPFSKGSKLMINIGWLLALAYSVCVFMIAYPDPETTNGSVANLVKHYIATGAIFALFEVGGRLYPKNMSLNLSTKIARTFFLTVLWPFNIYAELDAMILAFIEARIESAKKKQNKVV